MNRRQYIVMGVFGALFCVVSYLGWALAVKPVEAKITQRKADLSAAQDKLKEAEIKAAQHDKFQALAENNRRDLAFISERVDPALEKTELFRLLSSLGSRLSLGNYLFEVKPRAGSKDTGLTGMDEIPVHIKFNSGYHQIGIFLTSAISQDRLIVPDKFILTAMTMLDSSRPSVATELDFRLILEPVK